MVFPSMLSFTNLPILSIKHKISKAHDRCSCTAVISYALCALQTCAPDPQTKQHSSGKGRGALHQKCGGQPGKPSVSSDFWASADTSCHGWWRAAQVMPVSLQRCRPSPGRLSVQTERISDRHREKGTETHQHQPGWPEQAGYSEFWMTWIGERLNSTQQPRALDPRPISAMGSILPKAKGADEPEKPRARHKWKSWRGGIRAPVTQTISASFCEVWWALPPKTLQDWDS